MKPEELSAEQKTELTDKQIEAASGGADGSSPANEYMECASCGSTDTCSEYLGGGFYECYCRKCGYKWEYPY